MCIRDRTQLFSEANAIWRDQLHVQLTEANIHVLRYEELSKSQRNKLRAYFEREIFPVLTPLASDPSLSLIHI